MTVDVTIFEMSPRDGLQNERNIISTAKKVELVDLLTQCGFQMIEVASFVSPKWVPQMADGADVLSQIRRGAGIAYTSLTPNMPGLLRAVDAVVDEITIFAFASEAFSQKNTICSIADSLERFIPMMKFSKRNSLPVRGDVSCVTDCPYKGTVSPSMTARIAEKLYSMGCYEFSLGDTIDAGAPESVNETLKAILESVPANNLAEHFHNTHNRARDNIEISLERGLRVFDSPVSGLGALPLELVAKTVEASQLDATAENESYPCLSVAPQARSLGSIIDDTTIDRTIACLADAWESEEASEGISDFLDKSNPSWASQTTDTEGNKNEASE